MVSTHSRTVSSGPDSAPHSVSAPAVGRRTAIVCLVAGSGLNLTEAILGGVLGEGGDNAEMMADIAASPALAAAGLAAGTIAVPLMLVAFWAMAQLFAATLPRLAQALRVLSLVGTFGFFGLHAIFVLMHVAALQDDRGAMVGLFDTGERSEFVFALVVAPFLLGMTVSVLLAVVGLWRARTVPRGIPALMLAFVVLDFGPFSTGPVDPHWLWFAAGVWLAVQVARLDDTQWRQGRRAAPGVEAA